jgi:hypothetical protein
LPPADLDQFCLDSLSGALRLYDGGCRVQGLGFVVLGVSDSGFTNFSSGFMIKGLWCRVSVNHLWFLRSWVQGSGFSIQGSKIRFKG